ncbi:MAG: ABC transporter substrate-binding protein [Rhizobiaceae bacterium]
MVVRILLFLILSFIGTLTHAQDVIGLSLPLTGRFSPVADRIEFGAMAAINKLKADGRDIRVMLLDDGCSERNMPKVVEQLRVERVKIVVGPVCFDIAKQIAASMNGEGRAVTPVIALNTRNPLLQRYRKIDSLPLFELGNAPDAEARAVVKHILPRFHGRPFAILDDGSVYGRGLADQVRLLAQEIGLIPVENTNFRPLQTTQTSVLRRLKRSGVEALFVAASPEDIVTISSDLRSLQYNWIVGTGEAAQLLPFALNADSVPDELMMVRPIDLPTQTVAPLLRKFKDEKGDVEDTLMLGHALIEIAAAAVDDDSSKLDDGTFDTIIGPIHFGADGRAMPTPFGLYRWRGGMFSRVEP